MTARVALMFLGVLLAACSSTARMPVLEPALVDVPPEVTTIGVIDRSAPANVGEHIIGTLEGILTGEAIGANREGRASAVDALVRALEESPRYRVVRPNLTPQQAGTGLFDRPLDHRAVQRICREAGCDALLSLEAFNSSSTIHFDGRTYPSLQQINAGSGPAELERNTRVLTAWRLYDAHDDRILDATREFTRSRTWSRRADTFDEAARGLASQLQTVRTLGGVAGYDFGRRIAPTWVTVTRRYYGGGNPELRQARRYVRVNDWDGAASIWEDLQGHHRPRVVGKAAYNLALSYEAQGQLQEALAQARQASVVLHNPRTRGYVRSLERRIAAQERLERQMAEPEERPATSSREEPRERGDRDRSRSSKPDRDSGGTMRRPR